MGLADSLDATLAEDDDWFSNGTELSPQERLQRLADAFETEPDRADRLVQALLNGEPERRVRTSAAAAPEPIMNSTRRGDSKWQKLRWALTVTAGTMCVSGALMTAFTPARVPKDVPPGSAVSVGLAAPQGPDASPMPAPAQQAQVPDMPQRPHRDGVIDPDTAKVPAATPVPNQIVPAALPSSSDFHLTQPPPSRLTLIAPRGPHPTYRIGETLSFAVVPIRDSYVYCFYRDAKGSVARIFPNRFQPDPFVPAGTRVEVPSAGGQSFEIRFDAPGGTESVSCIAADRELGPRLPDSLMAHDLEPLPVSGLDEVSTRLRLVAGNGIDDERLVVNVTQ